MGESQHTGLARTLRCGQTEAERLLWAKLRNSQLNGVKFRRQQPVGEYIVDFVSFDEKLVVEIDGGQHAVEAKDRDEQRTAWLEGEGFRVIRFWNNDLHLADGETEHGLSIYETTLERVNTELVFRGQFKGIRRSNL